MGPDGRRSHAAHRRGRRSGMRHAAGSRVRASRRRFVRRVADDHPRRRRWPATIPASRGDPTREPRPPMSIVATSSCGSTSAVLSSMMSRHRDRRVPGEDVDDSALAVDREGDLRQPRPSAERRRDALPTDSCERGVRGVRRPGRDPRRRQRTPTSSRISSAAADRVGRRRAGSRPSHPALEPADRHRARRRRDARRRPGAAASDAGRARMRRADARRHPWPIRWRSRHFTRTSLRCASLAIARASTRRYGRYDGRGCPPRSRRSRPTPSPSQECPHAHGDDAPARRRR